MIDKLVDQFKPRPINSISGIDATFLYGETPTSPMHIGSVAVIEGSLKFETYKEIVASRIHRMPRLRQRLMDIPFGFDYPHWVDDPHFNLDLHILHVALPRPGGWAELRSFASSLFSEPLDRSRPLWSFTFVEGLDNLSQVPKGSVAVISKMHHVAIDGMGGAGLMALIFDASPEVKDLPPPKTFRPKPLPNDFGLLAQSAYSFVTRPLKLPNIIKDAAVATIKSGMLSRSQHVDLPTAPFTAPKTPLNGIISAKRKWNATLLELDRVKHLKNVMGTTLNDVVLAICAGALRRYLDEKKKLPKKPLVAMVPISIRTKEDKSNVGNQVSAMLIQLATDISDPIERLEVIHQNTIKGKTYQGALGAKTLTQLAEAVPFGVANQASRIYSRYNLTKLHNPIFNLTITNVPGPPVPIYLQGHKLFTLMGTAPIIDGMGLIITVFSYNGKITLSPTSDENSMPDIDVFTRYLREAANELEACVLNLEKEATKGKPKANAKPESDRVFNELKKYLKENPDFIKSDLGKFQFDIIGPVTGHWKIDLSKAPGKVTRGSFAESDATFTIRDKHLMRIGYGELDVASAFIQGRLSIKGDSGKAMKLGEVLARLPNLEKK